MLMGFTVGRWSAGQRRVNDRQVPFVGNLHRHVVAGVVLVVVVQVGVASGSPRWLGSMTPCAWQTSTLAYRGDVVADGCLAGPFADGVLQDEALVHRHAKIDDCK